MGLRTIVFRVDDKLRERLGVVAERSEAERRKNVGTYGRPVTVSDVARQALELGLLQLEEAARAQRRAKRAAAKPKST